MESKYEIMFDSEHEEIKFLMLMETKLGERHWTLKRLAQELNVAAPTMYLFTSGNRLKKSRFMAAKIAKELGIEESEFRDGK